jgi:hypothetical protein
MPLGVVLPCAGVTVAVIVTEVPKVEGFAVLAPATLVLMAGRRTLMSPLPESDVTNPLRLPPMEA